jgi:hypothetical protein
MFHGHYFIKDELNDDFLPFFFLFQHLLLQLSEGLASESW